MEDIMEDISKDKETIRENLYKVSHTVISSPLCLRTILSNNAIYVRGIPLYKTTEIEVILFEELLYKQQFSLIKLFL